MTNNTFDPVPERPVDHDHPANRPVTATSRISTTGRLVELSDKSLTIEEDDGRRCQVGLQRACELTALSLNELLGKKKKEERVTVVTDEKNRVVDLRFEGN